MAIGHSGLNWVVYHEQFFGGMTEVLMQQTNVFNGASANALRLVPRMLRGHYEQEAFISEISTLVTRRDIASVAAATDLPMDSDEFVGVKLNRKIGPVANTLDRWRKIAEDPETMSLLLGRQSGVAVAADYVNSLLIALEAALSGQSALIHDETAGGTTTLQYTSLVDGLSKVGDRANNIVAWVMHSKPFFDLFKDGITNYQVENVAGVQIQEGSIGSLNRPIVVTDSSALVISGTPTNYSTLGLFMDGGTVDESEDQEMESELVTGLENLVMRMQGEYAFNVRLRGFQWDITNGGANPTDAALGTASNWDKIATDNKSLPGVRILTT